MSGNDAVNEAFSDYSSNVIGGWDEISHSAKDAVGEAHESLWEELQAIMTDGKNLLVWDYILSMETDGVGTKVQIYLRQYENYFQEYEASDKNDKDRERLILRTIELNSRMLADLTAMLFDDGINGEQAIAFTNIIDANTTKWERADIFFEAFNIALADSILKNQVIVTNGETANLGENGKLIRLIDKLQEKAPLLLEDIKSDRKILSNLRAFRNSRVSALRKKNLEDDCVILIEKIKKKLKEARELPNFIIELLQELELNIWGTFLGIKSAKEENNKIEEIEEGDVIIILGERPTENGIVWPRSNGLTLIRKSMKELLWDNWENKTFEDYLDTIGDKRNNLPEGTIEKLAWLKMWDIATGETTIFNSFVSKTLLWWKDGKPNARISWLRHGTWNPQFKLYGWLQWREDLYLDIDVSKKEQADIAMLIQVAFDITDETAAESWNMKIPYVITCKPGEEDKILEMAEQEWIPAHVWGTVKKKDNLNDPDVILKGIWVNWDTVTYTHNHKK